MARRPWSACLSSESVQACLYVVVSPGARIAAWKTSKVHAGREFKRGRSSACAEEPQQERSVLEQFRLLDHLLYGCSQSLP